MTSDSTTEAGWLRDRARTTRDAITGDNDPNADVYLRQCERLEAIADTIESLQTQLRDAREALEGCEAYFKTLEETGDEKHPAMLRIIQKGLAAQRESGR